MSAFRLARRLGATGVHSRVWTTEDDVPVLYGQPLAGSAAVPPRDQLDVSRVASRRHGDAGRLLDAYGGDLHCLWSSPMRPSRAGHGGYSDYEQASGQSVVERLWLNHGDWNTLARWRETYEDVRLVNKSRRQEMTHGPERRAAQLSDAGIDVVNMHYADWKGGLVVLFARFGVLSFGWDAEHERMVDDLVAMNLDGIYMRLGLG